MSPSYVIRISLGPEKSKKSANISKFPISRDIQGSTAAAHKYFKTRLEPLWSVTLKKGNLREKKTIKWTLALITKKEWIGDENGIGDSNVASLFSDQI